MGVKVRFVFEGLGDVLAELEDSRNPKTSQLVADSLPLESAAYRWGGQIYFSTDIALSLENPQEEVEVGDVAYWPPAKAICLFAGKTPLSLWEKPRAVSLVNVVGRVIDNLPLLEKVKPGCKVKAVKV